MRVRSYSNADKSQKITDKGATEIHNHKRPAKRKTAAGTLFIKRKTIMEWGKTLKNASIKLCRTTILKMNCQLRNYLKLHWQLLERLNKMRDYVLEPIPKSIGVREDMGPTESNMTS